MTDNEKSRADTIREMVGSGLVKSGTLLITGDPGHWLVNPEMAAKLDAIGIDTEPMSKDFLPRLKEQKSFGNYRKVKMFDIESALGGRQAYDALLEYYDLPEIELHLTRQLVEELIHLYAQEPGDIQFLSTRSNLVIVTEKVAAAFAEIGIGNAPLGPNVQKYRGLKGMRALDRPALEAIAGGTAEYVNMVLDCGVKEVNRDKFRSLEDLRGSSGWGRD